jgi:hypothetical protein
MSDHHKALMQAFATIARREERERRRKALATIRAARKAGLPIKSVVVDDVRLEFGAAEPAAKTFDNEVEEWIKKHAH